MKYYRVMRNISLLMGIIFMLTACAPKITAEDIAFAKIEAYATQDGKQTVAPTIADYEGVGVIGIDTEERLIQINNIVAGLEADDVDTLEELQALVNTLTGNIVDVVAPIITIYGNSRVTVVQDSQYTDAGATAVDDVDGSIPVTTEGTVDTSQIGNYNIVYTATDSSNNRTHATRIVTVKADVVDVVEDTEAPIISIVLVNGSIDVRIAQNSTYTDAGATATDNIDGVVTVETTGTVDTSTVGDYSIIYTATDVAGNSATLTRVVTVEVSTTLTHNGTGYGTVVSPYTGKIWLDRNLGASRVCTSFNDSECYGDYYQWGRNYDGHEDPNSLTTSTLADDITNAGTDFIIVDSGVNSDDWATDIPTNQAHIRSTNWKKEDGSFVCPVDFRVATQAELSAELLDAGSAQIQNRVDAFNTFLKLPASGYRDHRDGLRVYIGTRGYLWQSGAFGNNSNYTYFTESTAGFESFGKQSSGMPIRCVSDVVSE